MTDKQKVKVHYPDGKGGHITTVKELKNKWNEESPAWQERFFEELAKTGTAYSRFGTYTLVS